MTTPYRTSAPTERRPIVVRCARCGREVGTEVSAPTFHCRPCALEQPTFRSEAEWPLGSLRATTFVAGNYDELAPFARVVAVDARCSQISTLVDGLPIDVTLDIDSGSVRGLELSASLIHGIGTYPEVVFRRESDADRDEKATGITRELQTDDPTFDPHVYIESDASDADLLIFLGGQTVRTAIVRLLRDFETITVGADSVAASRNFDMPACFAPDRIRSELAAMRALVGAPRPRELTFVPRVGVSLAWLGLPIGLPISPIFFALSWHFFPPLHATIFLVGAGVALMISLATLPLLTRILRGRSTSGREITLARFVSFIGLPFFVSALLVLANGALDGSASTRHGLKVTEVDFDSEDGDSKATATGAPGAHEFRFHDPTRRVKVGQTLELDVRPGALGFPWQASPARVSVEGAVLRED